MNELRLQVFEESEFGAEALTGRVNEWLKNHPNIEVLQRDVECSAAATKYTAHFHTVIVLWYVELTP